MLYARGCDIKTFSSDGCGQTTYYYYNYTGLFEYHYRILLFRILKCQLQIRFDSICLMEIERNRPGKI